MKRRRSSSPNYPVRWLDDLVRGFVASASVLALRHPVAPNTRTAFMSTRIGVAAIVHKRGRRSGPVGGLRCALALLVLLAVGACANQPTTNTDGAPLKPPVASTAKPAPDWRIAPGRVGPIEIGLDGGDAKLKGFAQGTPRRTVATCGSNQKSWLQPASSSSSALAAARTVSTRSRLPMTLLTVRMMASRLFGKDAHCRGSQTRNAISRSPKDLG